MHNNISIVEDCVGCEGCAFICPANCIKMQQNQNGFLYPVVDESYCLKCGKCLSICPAKNKNEFPLPLGCFAGRNRNDNVLGLSTSGGIFSVITDLWIKKEGYVCGPIFDKDFSVKHVCSKDFSIRDRMRGAKYVQSHLNGVFNEMRKHLSNGEKVLFSGTPCQVAAVNRIFNFFHEQGLLATVDIVCHGVPSPLVFKNHINGLTKKYGTILDYKFRDKELGWKGPQVSITLENGKKIKDTLDVKLYSKAYFSTLITRESCFSCQYANKKRPGDLTIGDFWGVENVVPCFNDNKGASLIFVNSEMGNEILEAIKSDIILYEVPVDLCKQHNLEKPTKRNPKSNLFWKNYHKSGLEKAYTKATRRSLISVIKKIVKKLSKNY